jgi:hypothetical protein
MPEAKPVINRYRAYMGSNVGMDQVARIDNEYGNWIKLEDVLATFGIKTPAPPEGVRSFSCDEDGVSVVLVGGCDHNIHSIHTSGGENWDDDIHTDSYNISIGPVTVWDLTSAQLSKLAVEAINHLRTNGHRFDYRYGVTDNRSGFVEIDLEGKVVVGEGAEKYHEKIQI